jgi:hypothetical protein
MAWMVFVRVSIVGVSVEAVELSVQAAKPSEFVIELESIPYSSSYPRLFPTPLLNVPRMKNSQRNIKNQIKTAKKKGMIVYETVNSITILRWDDF